jgi:hypothetical protein
MADSYNYAFVGAVYFAGTDVSFTVNGPIELNTVYSIALNPGSTDLFVTQPGGSPVDEGVITGMEWIDSPYAYCGTSAVCTVQLSLLTAKDTADGPTIAGTVIPGIGTYTEFFDHGTLTISPAVATPEPTTLALMLSGMALLGLMVVRKH